MSPALQADSLPAEPLGKPIQPCIEVNIRKKIKQGRSFIELTFSPPVNDYFSRYTRLLACTYLLFQH